MKRKSNSKKFTLVKEDKLFKGLDSEYTDSFYKAMKLKYEDYQSDQLNPFRGIRYFFEKKVAEIEYLYKLNGDLIEDKEVLSIQIHEYGNYKCNTHLELDILKFLDTEIRNSIKIIKQNVQLLDQAKANFDHYNIYLNKELHEICDIHQFAINNNEGIKHILNSVSSNLKLETYQSNSSLFNYDTVFKKFLKPKDPLPRNLLRNLFEIAFDNEIIDDGLTEETFIDIITGVNQSECIVFKCDTKIGILFIYSIRGIYVKFKPVYLEKSKMFRSNNGNLITANFFSKEKNLFKNTQFSPNHFVSKIEELFAEYLK